MIESEKELKTANYISITNLSRELKDRLVVMVNSCEVDGVIWANKSQGKVLVNLRDSAGYPYVINGRVAQEILRGVVSWSLRDEEGFWEV